MAEAIRAVLLLQSTSTEGAGFQNWAGTGDPFVELVFESEPQRIWRVRKTFGKDQAFLHESRNAVDFNLESKGRKVDERLREILRWGVAPPGGKGGTKGMPITFLSTALLGEQDRVAAIFDQTLSKDSAESGRERLIEALQAVAEDPLFKAVLDRVQSRVDEAFSSSGSKKHGKNSPWVRVREQIRRAEEYQRQCDDQLHKTDAIQHQLQQRCQEQVEGAEAVAKARGILRQIEESHQRGRLRVEILSRLQDCNARLTDITTSLQELHLAEESFDALTLKVNGLRDREHSAQVAAEEASRKAVAAQQEVARLQSEDRARTHALELTSLEKRRAELLTDQTENKTWLGRIQSAEAISRRVHEEDNRIGGLAAEIAKLEELHDASVSAVQAASARAEVVRLIGHFLRKEAAVRGIGDARRGLAQVEAWRSELVEKRAEADAIERDLATLDLPGAAELEAIQQLDRELQIARARVSVGMFVQIRPARQLRISIGRDGGASVPRELGMATFDVTAEREVHLDIEDVGGITVAGGTDDARIELGKIEHRWLVEAEPKLGRAGAVDLDELIHRAGAAAQRSQQVQDLRRASIHLELRIADQRDWKSILAGHERDLTAAEVALGATDTQPLRAMADERGLADATAAESLSEAARSETTKLVDQERNLDTNLTSAKAQLAEAEKSLANARDQLTEAISGFQGDLGTVLLTAVKRKSEIESELSSVRTALDRLSAETEETLAAAQAALKTAEANGREAKAEHFRIEEELRVAERQHATSEGELNMRRQAAAKLDESAARQAVAQVEGELRQVPPPPHDITDEMLDGARRMVTVAEDDLRRIEGEIQAQRGALQHVGGEVARQRAEEAHQASKAAREYGELLEIQYSAWDLLRTTLRDAERQEGVHLGRALAGPIAQRFTDLTGSRYGELTLGPHLETHTISANGDGRTLSSLSIGTRDQLSTIFRLTLAEQLGSTLLLDDQLTQSDAERMLWLRDLIRQVSAKIQIIVFTCRPGDYLVSPEFRPGKNVESVASLVRSLELSRLVERSDPARLPVSQEGQMRT